MKKPLIVLAIVLMPMLALGQTTGVGGPATTTINNTLCTPGVISDTASPVVKDAKLLNYAKDIHLINADGAIANYDITKEHYLGTDAALHQNFIMHDLWTLGTTWTWGHEQIFQDDQSPTPIGGKSPWGITTWNHIYPDTWGYMGGMSVESQNYSPTIGIQNTGLLAMASDTLQSEVLGTDGNSWACTVSHTSTAMTQPITGANYASYWNRTAGGTGANGFGTIPWTLGTYYSATPTGKGNMYGIQGTAWSYGSPGILVGVLGDVYYQGASLPTNIMAGVQSRIRLYESDGNTPKATGNAYGFYASPIVGGNYKYAFYSDTDPAYHIRTTNQYQTIDSAVYAFYDKVTQANDVQVGLYARSKDEGSVTAGGGHIIGVLGLAENTSISTMPAYGVEGRVNAIGPGWPYGVMGMANWTKSSPAIASPPLLVTGLQASVNITQVDGVTAASDSSSPLLGVGLLINPIVGGQYAYAIKASDPINVQAPATGVFANNGLIMADPISGNSAVALTTTRGVSNANCGGFSDACWQVNIDGAARYVPYCSSAGCNVSGGGGNVSNSGTPSIHQHAVWTDATHVKGVSVTPSKVTCTDTNGEPTACSNVQDVAYAPTDSPTFTTSAKFSFLSDGYVPYYSSTNGITNSPISTAGTNVGIGTTGPAAKLDIRPANEAGNNLRIYRGISAGYELDYMTIENVAAVNRFTASTAVGGGNINTMAFNVAGADRLFINTSGNIGIGTTAIPGSPRLGVSGTIGAYGLATDASNYQMGTLSASNGNGTTGSTTLSCAMAGTGAANCNVNLTPIGTASVVISAGTNILYRCVGGTGDGLISVNNANASCPVGTWTATSLKIN